MSVATYVVHVTVKMDAHTSRQAVTDALDAIESALCSHLGGERNSWHGYEKSNGHVVRAISVEGAEIAGARTRPTGTLAENIAAIEAAADTLRDLAAGMR